MNTSTPIIKVTDCSVNYGSHQVLKSISMTVAPSEIRAVLGTSGCGKTTLLKAMVGLVKPVSGTVEMLGTVMGEQDENATEAVLKKIGVLFQNGALLGSLSVEENVRLPLDMHTKLSPATKRDMVALRLTQVNLPHALKLYPSELSGGMRKRVALARALILDPPIVFCDEPSAGLDPVTSAGLDALLLRLRETLGITIVVVTHELPSIETIADSVSFLHEGTLLYEGSYAGAKDFSSGPIFEFLSRSMRHEVIQSQAHYQFVTERIS